MEREEIKKIIKEEYVKANVKEYNKNIAKTIFPIVDEIKVFAKGLKDTNDFDYQEHGYGNCSFKKGKRYLEFKIIKNKDTDRIKGIQLIFKEDEKDNRDVKYLFGELNIEKIITYIIEDIVGWLFGE